MDMHDGKVVVAASSSVGDFQNLAVIAGPGPLAAPIKAVFEVACSGVWPNSVIVESVFGPVVMAVRETPHDRQHGSAILGP